MQPIPLHSDVIDRIACEAIRDSQIHASEDAAIRTIAMVGALTDRTGTQLFCDDIVTLQVVIREISNAGIPVAPNPRILIYSLLPPVQCDFLRMANPENVCDDILAELTIISALPRTGVPIEKIATSNIGYTDVDREAYRDRFSDFDRLSGVSLQHTLQHAWADSAYNTRSSIVAARGTLNDELTIEDFTGEGSFIKIIGNCEGISTGNSLKVSGGIGFAVTPDFLEKYGRTLNPNSHLGRGLRTHLQKPQQP